MSEESAEIVPEEPKSPTGVAPTKDTWKHRRRMAYIAMMAQIVVTGLLFFAIPVEKIEVLQEPIVWFYFSFSSIVGAYVGFATWASFRGK